MFHVALKISLLYEESKRDRGISDQNDEGNIWT